MSLGSARSCSSASVAGLRRSASCSGLPAFLAAALGKVPVPNGETQDAVILQQRPDVERLGDHRRGWSRCRLRRVCLVGCHKRPDVRVVAALCGVFFAIAVILRLRPGGGRASTLALTPWGLLDKEGVEGLTCVPWTVIGGVRQNRLQGPACAGPQASRSPVGRARGRRQGVRHDQWRLRPRERSPGDRRETRSEPDRIESLVQQFLDTSRSRATDGGAALRGPRSTTLPQTCSRFVSEVSQEGLLPSRGPLPREHSNPRVAMCDEIARQPLPGRLHIKGVATTGV